MRYWKDIDGDIWVEHADGSLICVAVNVTVQAREGRESGVNPELVRQLHGPLIELVEKA